MLIAPGSNEENSRFPFLVHPLTRRTFASEFTLALVGSRLPAQEKPRRIVSRTPSITGALFALGLGDQVVGVSPFCDFPAAVLKLPKIGTYLAPDAETIARLAPDPVICQRSSSEEM